MFLEKRVLMTMTVCKGCGAEMNAVDDFTGKPACLICIGGKDNSVPSEVDAPERLTCHCGATAELGRDLSYRITLPDGSPGPEFDRSLPFMNATTKKFYCGHDKWN